VTSGDFDRLGVFHDGNSTGGRRAIGLGFYPEMVGASMTERPPVHNSQEGHFRAIPLRSRALVNRAPGRLGLTASIPIAAPFRRHSAYWPRGSPKGSSCIQGEDWVNGLVYRWTLRVVWLSRQASLFPLLAAGWRLPHPSEAACRFSTCARRAEIISRKINVYSMR
jgi:hypothetical protein